MPPRRLNDNQRVYFIRPIGMEGPIKIGCSAAPDRRRDSLERWCPFPLEVIATIAGNGIVERRFHARFAASHIRHEWFAVTADLLATIAQINAGAFDISTLPEPMRVTHLNGRDNSYSTPAWRYRRSVESRLQALRARGLPWNDPERQALRLPPANIREEEMGPHRERCEDALARMQARFPPLGRRKVAA